MRGGQTATQDRITSQSSKCQLALDISASAPRDRVIPRVLPFHQFFLQKFTAGHRNMTSILVSRTSSDRFRVHSKFIRARRRRSFAGQNLKNNPMSIGRPVFFQSHTGINNQLWFNSSGSLRRQDRYMASNTGNCINLSSINYQSASDENNTQTSHSTRGLSQNEASRCGCRGSAEHPHFPSVKT